MDEGVFGLEKKQRLIVYGIMYAPSILIPLIMLMVRDSLFCMIVLQTVCYCGLPYYYIKKVSKEQELSVYFLSEF